VSHVYLAYVESKKSSSEGTRGRASILDSRVIPESRTDYWYDYDSSMLDAFFYE